MSEYTKIYEEKMTGAVHHLGKRVIRNSCRARKPCNSGPGHGGLLRHPPTPINQMAAVAVAEARILTITPGTPA